MICFAAWVSAPALWNRLTGIERNSPPNSGREHRLRCLTSFAGVWERDPRTYLDSRWERGHLQPPLPGEHPRSVGLIGEQARMKRRSTPLHRPPVHNGPHFSLPRLLNVRTVGEAWKVPTDLQQEFLSPEGVRLAEWRENGAVRIVQTSSRQTVYRLDLFAGQFFLKHTKPRNWWERLRGVLRADSARREWSAAVRLQGAGIATLDPVACGTGIAGHTLGNSYLITRAIDGVVPLGQFCARTLPQLPAGTRARVRQALAVEVGRTLARLAAARMAHAPLRADDLLVRVGEDGQVGLWVAGLGHLRRQSPRRMPTQLAALDLALGDVVTLADRCRCLRAFAQAAEIGHVAGIAPPASHPHDSRRTPGGRHQTRERLRAFFRHVQGLRERLAAESFRRQDRRWQRGGGMILVDSHRFRSRSVPTFDLLEIETCCRQPAALLGAEYRRYWCRRSPSEWAAAVRVPIRGCQSNAFLRALPAPEQRRGWRRTDSTARQLWETGHALLRRGIPTPRPLMCIEPRFRPVLETARPSVPDGASYLLTQEVAGAVELSVLVHTRLRSLDGPCRRTWEDRLAARLGREVYQLHAAGFDHFQLTPDNLLIRSDPMDCKVWFLGVRHIVRVRRLTFGQRMLALGELNRHFSAGGWIRHRHRVVFLKRYLRAMPRADWKRIWRQIADEDRG